MHCQPVKMGLTAEVKGCVFNGWHPAYRRLRVALYSWAKCSVWFDRRRELYSNSLPMCYCVHVKDGLPQLGYKKTHLWHQEQDALLCVYQRAQWVAGASNFPSTSTSSGGIHVYVTTCFRPGVLYVHVMLSHPETCPVRGHVTTSKRFRFIEARHLVT